MKAFNKNIASLFLTTLLVAGCTSKMSGLTDAIDTYNKTLKWGGFPAVARYLDGDTREEILKKKTNEMADRTIVEYQLANASLDPNKDTATAIVNYTYIEESTQNLLGSAEIQVWKVDRGHWYLSKIIDSTQRSPNTLE